MEYPAPVGDVHAQATMMAHNHTAARVGGCGDKRTTSHPHPTAPSTTQNTKTARHMVNTWERAGVGRGDSVPCETDVRRRRRTTCKAPRRACDGRLDTHVPTKPEPANVNATRTREVARNTNVFTASIDPKLNKLTCGVGVRCVEICRKGTFP